MLNTRTSGPGFHDDSNAQVDDEHVGEDHVHLRATPGPSSNGRQESTPSSVEQIKESHKSTSVYN